MKKIYKYLLIAILLLAVFAYYFPWKPWLETRIRNELAASGIEQIEFSIESVGLEEITFKNIVFGELKLPAFSINYTPMELWQGNFRKLHAESLVLHKDKLQINLYNINVSLESSQWQIDTINIVGTPVELPALAGKGTLKVTDSNILLAGDIYSADTKTKVSFSFDYPTDDSKSANIKIINAKLPWSDGVLSVQNISIPLYASTPIPLTLKVQQISLNNLLAAATSNRASATGVVSGTIPIVIARDGSLIVKKGNLKADKAGTLALSPDVIPSDTTQVALLRDVLKDFHYSILSMGIESADNKQLSMLLSLEGNNPEVYNGRVVKLNVHLTGDVIELITKSMMMMDDLKK